MAVLFLGESIEIKGILGVILALVSVYLVSAGGDEKVKFNVVLILVFLGSGMVDTGLNLIKYANFQGLNNLQFATITFGGAAVVAMLVSIFQMNKWRVFLSEKIFYGVLMGVLLGSINYFSIVAMYEAIDSFEGKTGVFFTLNNIGVLLLTLFLGYFFGEKYKTKTFLGVVFAITAILLLGF